MHCTVDDNIALIDSTATTTFELGRIFCVLGGIFNSLQYLTMQNGVFFTFTEWLTDRYWELQNQSTHAEASKPRAALSFFSIRLCAFLSWLSSSDTPQQLVAAQ